jgi:glycosyltransferase involved in cell wall biosynthesis
MPDRGSGELRLFSLLKILAADHKVTLYTWSWGQEVSDEAKVRYRDNLTSQGVVLESHGLRRLLQAERYDAIVFEWYYWVDWYLQDVKTWQPNARIVIDTVDIEFRRLKLQAQAAGGLSEAQLHSRKRRELCAYEKADLLIAVSNEERAMLADELPEKAIAVIPNIHAFPEVLPTLTEEPNLIFVGNFRFDPNLDAVEYFCSEIWPAVRAEIPHARFRIVGNCLPAGRPLFGAEGIEAVGYVPDTGICFKQSRVSVAPLRFGAGIKGKVGEAVAAGVPVVTTPVGVQGMPLASGIDIQVADSPRGFADAVVRLLSDFDACNAQRESAWNRLRSEFGPAAVEKKLSELLERVAELPCRPLPLWRRWARRGKFVLDERLFWRFGRSQDAGSDGARQSPGLD